jgi:transposase
MFIEYAGKTGHVWWLWLFLGCDTVCFTLDPHRSHNVPEAHFEKAGKVTLMVDRYSAYKAMSGVKDGRILLAFCWAHVRRDFVKVGKSWPALKSWALAWLRRIRVLYQLQAQRQSCLANPSECALLLSTLREHVAAMKLQAETELAAPSVAVGCRGALESLLKHWCGLTRFLDDVRIPLDNNAAEREHRKPVVGRKNYYGSGALWSGQLAAMLFSIFATLEKWGVNPRKWLSWYLESCAINGGQVPSSVAGYLPWNLSSEQRRLMSDEIEEDEVENEIEDSS